jgi:hypothetical protein
MPRRRSTTTPTSTPTRTSRKRPTVEPISAPGIEPDRIVFSVYELVGFNEHRKCHPNYYGDCLGEFLTPTEAKRYLRDHQRYGAFAIVERVNGKIGRAWPYEIDPPEDDVDYNPGGDPRVENAALKARLEAMRNGAHNPVLEKMAERFLDEKMKDPLDQLTGTAEKYERLRTMFGARQSNPAEAYQQTNDSDLETIKVMAGLLGSDDANIRESANDAIGKIIAKAAKDELSLAEVAMEAVKSGQLPQMVNTVFTGLGNLFSMFRQPQGAAPTQQPPQTQQPVQPQQPPQQVPPAQQPQQELQTSQPDQAQVLSPEEQALALLVNHCARNQPVKVAFDRLMNFADAINEQAPDCSIDGYIEMFATMPTEAALAFVASRPGFEAVANMAHAHTWCETMQRIIRDNFLDEGAGEFDEVTEVNGGGVKL